MAGGVEPDDLLVPSNPNHSMILWTCGNTNPYIWVTEGLRPPHLLLLGGMAVLCSWSKVVHPRNPPATAKNWLPPCLSLQHTRFWSLTRDLRQIQKNTGNILWPAIVCSPGLNIYGQAAHSHLSSSGNANPSPKEMCYLPFSSLLYASDPHVLPREYP